MNSVFNDPKNPIRIISIVLGVILSLWLITLAIGEIISYDNQENNPYPTKTITVAGFAKKSVAPDTAILQITSQVEGTTAEQAQTRLNEQAAKIDAVIAEAGVDPKDVTTVSYSLNPRYVYPQFPPAGGVSYADRRLVGFEIIRTLQVKIRNLDTVAGTVAKLSAAGVTNFSGPSFVIDNYEKAQAEVRLLAIENAEAQAREVARRLDVDLDGAVGFYDQQPMPYNRPGYGYGGVMMERSMDMAQSAPAAATTPTGEFEVTASVNVTYEID